MMTTDARRGITLLAALLFTLSSPAVAVDLIFSGGPILTINAAQPSAEAVAVADGRIVAVGNHDEVMALASANTRHIDLAGATLMPGFIEGHGHFLGFGEALMTLDLSGHTRFEQTVAAVAAAAAEAAPGEWITGRGWHQERWQDADGGWVEGVPTHHALSAVSPDNPVMLVHASGHALMANARAMAAADIDANSPDPEGGVIIRDAAGQPTGFMRQSAQWPVRRALAQTRGALSPAQHQARLQRQVELAGAEALRHGVTSFHDQGSSLDEIAALVALADAGRLPIRLHLALRGHDNDTLRARLAAERRIGHADHFLTVRAIKVQIDGALGTHGAWLLEPYADRPDTAGLPQVALDTLRETAALALEHGYQLNVHAIGDRGNREALNLYQQFLNGHEGGTAPSDLRWRIEHAQNLHPDEVPRFAELGVTASMQGIHATSDGPWVPQRLGQLRAQQRAYVWRALLDAEALICNGTDVPVEPISPLASLQASITRRMANGEVFFAEQAMQRQEALHSYTLGCAKAVFEEDLLGSIEVGKLADLVVLSDNPLSVPADQIAEIEVMMTLLAGEVRFQRER